MNIKVKINGKDIELKNSMTISDMILERQIVGSMFVIERNKKVVAKDKYLETSLEEADVIEIVGFFGGG